MLKALLFGVLIFVSAIVVTFVCGIAAVALLFATAATATEPQPPVFLLESAMVEEVEYIEDIEDIKIVDEIKISDDSHPPVFLLEVVPVPDDTEEEITTVDLNDLTIPKLKELAKEKGIYVKSSLRKAQIIELLSA